MHGINFGNVNEELFQSQEETSRKVLRAQGRERAADFLAAHPSALDRSVGVIGFCMGGMYAVLAACLCHGFAASGPFYGLLSYRHGMLARELGLDPERKPHEPLAVAERLQCPLLGFFGAEDALVPLADVRELEAGFERSGRAHDVVVVEGAGHAFMNDTRPEAYREPQARLAWRRMVGFLREQLA